MAADEGSRFMRQAGGHLLALDRASVRSLDVNGHLHVERSNISKAMVNPYFGKEIPDAKELGLDENRIYQLLRDPEELAKAADTFNNLPILSKHLQTWSAQTPQKQLIIGSTGTDAAFDAPFLHNSLVLWDAAAIRDVESEEARELSCAYRYVADMTPGTYEGAAYDGVMRELRGNHVALVGAGRAGPDVIVGDEKPKLKEDTHMKQPLSRRATLAKGALLGLVKPILAADSKLDLNVLLAGVTAKNWHDKKPGLLAAIRPKLAADASMEGIVQLLDAIEQDDPSDPNSDPMKDDMLDATDADPLDAILNMLRGKLSDPDLAAVEAQLRTIMAPAATDPPAALDAPPPTPGAPPPPAGTPPTPPTPPQPKPAMDSAAVTKLVATAVAAAEVASRQRSKDAAEAREVVRPYMGAVSMALDSADAIYKAALDSLGIKVEGVHPSAYRPILEQVPKPGQQRQAVLAQDSGDDIAALNKIIPGLADMKTTR